jgi:hypothetical protein
MSFYYTTHRFTEVFPLNGEAQKAATQLMEKLQLKETSRVIIGNDPKNLFVCLTWEGKSDVFNLFKDYYITIKRDEGPPIYYHRLFLNGVRCTLKEFSKKVKDTEESGGEFEMQNLKD